MSKERKSAWMLAAWALAVGFIGSVLMSFHQPFRAPEAKVLALAGPLQPDTWSVVHVLSGSCDCSQRVMRHLLNRRMFPGVSERVLLIDGEEPYLTGTNELLAQLTQAGFSVAHIAVRDIPADTSLHGVPLLLVASTQGKLVYMGGYGMAEDQDGNILQTLQAGRTPQVISIRGCAIGAHIRRTADPFHFKY